MGCWNCSSEEVEWVPLFMYMIGGSIFQSEFASAFVETGGEDGI